MPVLCQITHAVDMETEAGLSRHAPILNRLDEHHHTIGQVVMIGTDARHLGSCAAALLNHALNVPFEAVATADDAAACNDLSSEPGDERLVLIDNALLDKAKVGELLAKLNHLPNIVMGIAFPGEE